jgi:hypothetical protein
MKFVSLSAAILAASLTLSTAASAQGPLPAPLPAPPPPGAPVSSTLFDAMLGIARAAQSNPSAAQNATFSYNAAIQQYNIGDFNRARQSALTALSQTMTAPLPQPSLVPPAIPQPTYYQMPLLSDASQADVESYVALARRAMTSCGAPNATAPAAIQQEYASASKALVAKNYRVARASSLNVVDDCAAATRAYAGQQAALPQASNTPMPLASYVPEPLATLGPDPALQQGVR